MFHTYVDWTTEVIPRPFYVGKGNDNRTRNPSRNQKHKWIRNHFGHRREIVFSSDDESACLQREIDLIKDHRTYAYCAEASELACNFTQGGDGTSGYKHTDEFKARIKTWRKPGHKHSLESKQRMSQAHTGQPKTREWIDKINQANWKPVRLTKLDGSTVDFKSNREASEKTGTPKTTISGGCRSGKRIKGNLWSYVR